MKWTPKNLAIAAGVVLVAGWYVKRQAGEALDKVGQAVNPTSDQNLAYKGVNSVGEALTGDDAFSLGSWLYDLTHPNEGKDLTAPVPIRRNEEGEE